MLFMYFVLRALWFVFHVFHSLCTSFFVVSCFMFFALYVLRSLFHTSYSLFGTSFLVSCFVLRLAFRSSLEFHSRSLGL